MVYFAHKKSRFFVLLKKYKQDSDEFSVFYKRGSPHRISTHLEELIIQELVKEKQLIENSDIPLTTYNYCYILDQLYKDHQLKVSVPTIIRRAKEHNYYIPKKPRKVHDREIVTNYPGELIFPRKNGHIVKTLFVTPYSAQIDTESYVPTQNDSSLC